MKFSRSIFKSLIISTIAFTFLACDSTEKGSPSSQESIDPKEDPSVLSFPSQSGENSPPSTASGDVGNSTTDLTLNYDEESLKSFLLSGSYLIWPNTGEQPFQAVSAHASTAKVYFNQVLTDALASGATEYPQGSVAVKEIYDASGQNLTARAIEVKVSQNQGADSWVFFEGFVSQNNSGFYQVGAGFCSNCHGASDSDFVVARPQ